ncbi:MAG: hypothetical protein ABW185_26365 [Sedimenticola sp.]
MSEKVTSVTNADLLNTVLDYYLESNGVKDTNVHDCNEEQLQPTEHAKYLLSDRNVTNDEYFLVSRSALQNICLGILQHQSDCGSAIHITEITRFGHVGKVKFVCHQNHTLKMDTSPHIEGGKYLANMQIMHGVYASGLRYIQYERFCQSAMFGQIAESTFLNLHDIYCDVTKAIREESVIEARQVEELTTIQESEDHNYEYKGIGILTDARHGTRRNAKHSDVIALGNKCHKVVGAVTVTKDDDSVSQRHELYGVRQLYQEFDNYGLSVHVHGHDRNASVNKYLRVEQPCIENANDTWHATKGIAKQLKHIVTGPKRKHGITWHDQLRDKAASIKTHAYYAMKHCSGSGPKLRSILDNTTAHYQNKHEHCLPNSRCKTEEYYIPSKVIITDSAAASILTKAIHSLQVYKTPEDFVHCRDTHYVESFNNACLIYHDKRISFGTPEYLRRTNMAILDWNENVDREYTSISMWEDPRNPRRQSGKKNLKPKTYNFKANHGCYVPGFHLSTSKIYICVILFVHVPTMTLVNITHRLRI